MASSSRSDALTVEALAYAWPGRARPDLEHVDLRVAAGECVFLAGASGAGKTTLLRAVAGVLPRAGRRTGSVRVAGGRPALLLQHLDAQLLCTRVDEEVRFGLELRGVAEPERARRAGDALAALGLAGFAERAVDDLSAGEKQRVLLAALLALEPGLLLLDEPSSQLDRAGRARLVACLHDLKRRGHAILLADHCFEPFASLVDRCVALKEGRLAPGEAPAPPVRAAPPPPVRAAPLVRGGSPALDVAGLHVADAEGRPVLAGLSLALAPGERVHVVGDNGAGKSTLLRAAAGLLRPARGRVRVGGAEPPAALGRVALLFQSPERNLFETSVAEELAFTLRRTGVRGARLEERVARLLERCGLAHLRERSPLRLSFGEQHRVALASLLAPRPDLLLLDEPFAGLDVESRGRVLELLDAEQREAGFAVLIASHDPLPAPGWAHRELALRQGVLQRA